MDVKNPTLSEFGNYLGFNIEPQCSGCREGLIVWFGKPCFTWSHLGYIRILVIVSLHAC